jgi:hypothetical protein
VTAAAAGLPVEVEQLMRQLKMPYARALAPELLVTAKAQRWEPVEVVKALLVEEVAGRSRSMLAHRRKAAGFPTGKTLNPGHRHRRPAPPPRPHLPNQRRLDPPHPSPRRERSPTPPLTITMNGQRVPGRSAGRDRAPVTATTGQVPRPPPGRSSWPLTPKGRLESAELALVWKW